MEHRYCQRVPTNVKVLIYQQGLPVAIGRLRDVGRYGVLVESDYKDFSVNQPLEIELLLRNVVVDDHAHCKVRVMHKVASGFGAAIEESCSTSYTMLALLTERFRSSRVVPIGRATPDKHFSSKEFYGMSAMQPRTF